MEKYVYWLGKDNEGNFVEFYTGLMKIDDLKQMIESGDYVIAVDKFGPKNYVKSIIRGIK